MTDTERMLTGLARIFALGVGAQWLAAKLRVPSILLVLSTGHVGGRAGRTRDRRTGIG